MPNVSDVVDFFNLNSADPNWLENRLLEFERENNFAITLDDPKVSSRVILPEETIPGFLRAHTTENGSLDPVGKRFFEFCLKHASGNRVIYNALFYSKNAYVNSFQSRIEGFRALLELDNQSPLLTEAAEHFALYDNYRLPNEERSGWSSIEIICCELCESNSVDEDCVGFIGILKDLIIKGDEKLFLKALLSINTLVIAGAAKHFFTKEGGDDNKTSVYDILYNRLIEFNKQLPLSNLAEKGGVYEMMRNIANIGKVNFKEGDFSAARENSRARFQQRRPAIGLHPLSLPQNQNDNNDNDRRDTPAPLVSVSFGGRMSNNSAGRDGDL